MKRSRWLVFGVGNPSRGDDALGPLFVERLEQWSATAGDLPVALATLTDFQWQVEHALDLIDVDVTVFVDASLRAAPPFEIAPLAPAFDATHSTHALSPACVLATAERLGQILPQAWLLAIRGETFELGAEPSPASCCHLDAALDFLLARLAAGQIEPLESLGRRPCSHRRGERLYRPRFPWSAAVSNGAGDAPVSFALSRHTHADRSPPRVTAL